MQVKRDFKNNNNLLLKIINNKAIIKAFIFNEFDYLKFFFWFVFFSF